MPHMGPIHNDVQQHNYLVTSLYNERQTLKFQGGQCPLGPNVAISLYIHTHTTTSKQKYVLTCVSNTMLHEF